MAKLYPPHIEGALPAFCGNSITIPFEHSRAVAPAEINGYHFIFKDIQQSKIITPVKVSAMAAGQDSAGNWELNCTGLNTSQLVPGTFYKLQLAYLNKSEQTGYFSDVGIIKYIQKPTVKIVDSDELELSQTGINNHKYHYQLVYECKDATEKLYSTQFVLLEGNKDNIIAASNEIIHNTVNDTIYTGTEKYDFLQELDSKKNYWIMAMVTTVSGYKLMTPYYPIGAQVGIPDLSGTYVNPVLDFDNGCISIYLYSTRQTSFSGRYKLVRADEKEFFSIWHPMIEINFQEDNITEDNQYLFWRDFTVEQGYNYIYALMQINNKGNYTTKIKSNYIHADFEDAFLFDGDKQLRIRFDPKVSSFKITVQEAKVDTIGGRYPIIQRNGYTNYKEFPISGLISHLSDPAGYFNKSIATLKEIDNTNVVTDLDDAWDGLNYQTNLNSKNVQLERQFKLEVLNWLNNGKAKLFRSPTEGNYLVRLLNISLSPVDTLGRMLHSFSCTAYEIDEANPEKLIKHDIIKDYFLEGRHNYDFDRNTISYYLSNLGNNNFIETQRELQNKNILSAAFAVQENPDPVLVNINGTDIDVRNGYTYSEPITSLSQGTGQVSYATHDLITLSYKNVLSSEFYNNFIESIFQNAEVNQYYGFNYQNTFGDIKLFLQKIYKMICNVRPRIEKIIDISLSALLEIAGNGVDALKAWVQANFHCCIGSMIYKVLDTDGNVIAYIDGNKGTIIDMTKNVANAIVTFVHSSGILPTIYNITKETIFTDVNFDNTIENIIANPFTCVDIIYKTGINVYNTLSNTASVVLASVSSQNTALGESGNPNTADITGELINTCENIYNTVVTSLKNNGAVPTNININSANVDGILQGTIKAGADLCNAAISVLGSVTSLSATSLITEVSSSVMNLFCGSFSGLFGGMC